MALKSHIQALFRRWEVRDPPARRKLRAIQFSLAVHGLVIALLILTPLFSEDPVLEYREPTPALFFSLPPPPPLALPKGSVVVKKLALTPVPTPEQPIVVATLEPEEISGVSGGTDHGSSDGMEHGVDGGEIGGVPGGIVGGVIGGTGVEDYDHPPKPIRSDKPIYPSEAFKQRIEGTVMLEILIDADGRVKRAGVVQSIPALDAAAIQCVMRWVFQPAVKDGRPVAAIARAPITFRIH